ncbi:alkaline phosphatase [Malassezia cuniculi]|uniref:Alkaline phosphatase n=1 Tax=Malassezia cuniculi TaxID=948313 RepID=A0AAF0J530_9BASI|nr:alkaline phosphatase [Malassezia cuniculi]
MPGPDSKQESGNKLGGTPKGASNGAPSKQADSKQSDAARVPATPSAASDSSEARSPDSDAKSAGGVPPSGADADNAAQKGTKTSGKATDKATSKTGGTDASHALGTTVSLSDASASAAETAQKVLDAATEQVEKVAAYRDGTAADFVSDVSDAIENYATNVSNAAAKESRKLHVFQGIVATLLRLLVLLSLRVFPLRACAAVLVLYATYLAIWLVLDSSLKSRSSQAGAARRKRSFFRGVLFGVSTHSRKVNFVLLGFHTIVALFFLDFYYSPHMFPSYYDYNLRFARVGALTPNSATIHVRYPHPLPPLDGLWDNDNDGVLYDASLYAETPVRVVWRRVLRHSAQVPAGAAVRDPRRWERGPLLRLAEDSDWTATALIDNLWPATEYEWRLAFVHNNTFAPLPERPVSFVTWPDPKLAAYLKTRRSTHTSLRNAVDDPNHFTFAATSCIKPDFPYHPAQFWLWNWFIRAFGVGGGPGGVTKRNRIRGFDLMAERLVDAVRETPGIRFLLELGDVIYADVPHYEGAYISSYRKLYRNLFASDSFRRIYSKIPVLGIFDDHEVVNNWSGAGDGFKTLPDSPPAAFKPGIKAWSEYIGSANTPSSKGEQHYFSFQYGDSAFFVVDARTHRTHPHIQGPERTMLGEKQRGELLDWLARVNHTATFKFIVTPVPFTSVWGGPLDLDGHLDGWPAYADDRKAVLDVLQYVPNVIIISGDRHEFAAVSMRDSVLEFSTSPLSMFYIPIRTAAQEHVVEPDNEVFLKYLPDGHHKWTEFEVDTRDPHDPVVHVTVLINGNEAWNVTVHGHPVRRAQGAIGSIAQSLLELLGFKPRKWFD